MKRFQWTCIALIAALSTAPAIAQTSLPADEIDIVLERAVQQRIVPGIVAMVATKDRILYQGAFGTMDAGKQKLMQKDSIFRIASMTKPVTSAAVMLLVDEGKLRLDDPVSRYLPGLKEPQVISSFNKEDGSYTTKKASKEIAIRHLLSNTSGFAYAFSNDMTNVLQQKKGRGQEELPLLYEPGTQWTYSGSTKVLGQVIEKITGAGLDQFLNQRLFKPLGIEDTSYAVPPNKTDRVVTVNRRTNGALVETPNPEKIQAPVAGDGGLFSTASDYIRFLQMFLNDGKWNGTTLVRKESIQAMTKNQIGSVIVHTQHTTNPALSMNFPIGAGRDKFGFGFQITASNKENPLLREPGSYTWAGIHNTHFWVDPKRKIAAVILMQVLPFYDEDAMKVYQDFEAAVGKNLK